MMEAFSYDQAFSRNLGWVTAAEQTILRHKRIAIAGLGGVGGSHLITLARLGVGAFNIADFDSFEIHNFNRQAGALVSSLGQPKVDVLARMALDVNPELKLKRFPQGIADENIAGFLDDVDLYVDGLDYFALDVRQKVFEACAERHIPALTAAPLGMGVALLNFLPGSMTFEDYFRLQGKSTEEQAIRFLLGLSPAMLQMRYLVDKSRVNLAERRGPSTVMACQLCAGFAATEALKILLNRGKIVAAPRGIHFDAYRNKLVTTWRPFGNNNPIQKLGLAIARRQIGAQASLPPQTTFSAQLSTIEQILDLARWAPSGDNTQVWRFEIMGETDFAIHGYDTREHCVYDVDGHPSQIALGALLENIVTAATGHGLQARFTRRPSSPDEKPIFDVHLSPEPGITPDPLIPFIPLRSVQRRPLQTSPLTPQEKQALETAVGENYRILWLDGLWNRACMAKLLFNYAKIRLTMPEAYQVHREVIQWNVCFSEDKVPDKAIGLDPLATRLMRWVMQSWGRVDFFNRYLAGTWMPRIQLDLLPGLFCGAHYVIVASTPHRNVNEYIEAGRGMQRFWLTATQLGLQMQPELTPLIFSTYIRNGVRFSRAPHLWELAERLSTQLQRFLGSETCERAVFMGRLGSGPAATARSLRKPLRELMLVPLSSAQSTQGKKTL